MKELLDALLEDLRIARKNKLEIIFTIGFTANNNTTYLSPCRILDDYLVLGIICGDSKTALSIGQSVCQLVDVIFVDIEKKQKPYFSDDKIDTGNLYHLILNNISDSCMVLPYRPNLLTVDSAIEQCTDLLRQNKNLKIGVVGLGNIGFKLSSNLVETGFDVYGLPKAIGFREKSYESAINFMKPAGTISTFLLVDTLEKLAIRSDVLIFCATQEAIINKGNYRYFQNKSLLLDIGKNNICKSIVAHLPNARWLDVGSTLVRYLVSLYKLNLARREFKKLKAQEKIVGSHALPGETLVTTDGTKVFSIGCVNEDGKFQRFRLEQVIKSCR